MINLNNYDDFKVSEQISDTLDSALVSILTDKKMEYKKFELVTLNNKNWYVFNINYKQDNTGILNEISLIEPTKILENYIKVGMSFTDNYSLYNEIDEILLKFDATNFNNTFYEYINTPAIDLKYQNAITLREVLDDVLSSVDCAIRYDGNKLYAEKLDNKGNLIDLNALNKNEINDSIDAEYDVGGIVATADNVFSEKNVVENLVPRNAGGIYDNTKGSLYTQYPIINLNSVKVEAMFRATGSFENSSGKKTSVDGNVIFDIGDFCYEYNQWLLLPSNPNVVEKGTVETSFYYKLKDNEIGGLLDLNKPNGWVFSVSVYRQICILVRTLNPYKARLEASVKKVIEDMGYTNIVVNNIILNQDESDIHYAIVDYDPIFTAYLNVVKHRDDKTRILMNTNAEQVNLRAFSKNVQGVVNRVGNRELSINMMHNSVDDMLNLHDYTADNYIIDNRNYAVKNGYIVAQYHLTKDFNNMAENIRLNREKRLYNIPDDAIIRIINFDGNFEIKNEAIAPRNNLMSKLITSTFTNEKSYPIENLKLKTNFEGSIKFGGIFVGGLYQVKNAFGDIASGMEFVNREMYVRGGIKNYAIWEETTAYEGIIENGVFIAVLFLSKPMLAHDLYLSTIGVSQITLGYVDETTHTENIAYSTTENVGFDFNKESVPNNLFNAIFLRVENIEAFKTGNTYSVENPDAGIIESENANIPVIAYTGENSIYFSGKCYDNYAVGYFVDTNNITSPVPYVDENGECDNATIILCSKLRDEYLSASTVKKLPQVRPYLLILSPYYGEYGKVVKEIKKDKYETLKFVFKFDFINDLDECLFGSAFYKYNRLCSDANIYPLKIYLGNEWNNKDELTYSKVADTWQLNSLDDNGVQIAIANANNYKYFEIVTNDNKLLLRANYKYNKMYFY